MRCQKYALLAFKVAALVCILLCVSCFGTSSTKIDLEQAIKQQLNKEQFRQKNPESPLTSHDAYHQLKRKRRYLEFPEGSSFQLVYDLIVGVVDFTNYLILGVTVALAWELPSKPPSEIFDDLSERLKDGTLGISRNDTVENGNLLDLKTEATTTKTSVVKYKFNLKPMFGPPMHYQYYTPNTHNANSRLHAPHHTRNQSNPFLKWTQDKTYPKFSVKGTQYPWWSLSDRLKNSFVRRPSIRRFDKNTNVKGHSHNKRLQSGTPLTFQGIGRSEHRIYPVFGKRSISVQQIPNENLSSTNTRYKSSGIAPNLPSKIDRIHVEHHRKTRHHLYQRIETYLNGRGSHGHHCVLKALCETAQKSDERKPGSFVGELMRAIFTIPAPFDAVLGQRKYVSDKVLRYDAASSLKHDCSRRYTHCKESLWSSHFVL